MTGSAPGDPVLCQNSADGRIMRTHKPSQRATVIGLPRVGGLHHLSTWAEAA